MWREGTLPRAQDRYGSSSGGGCPQVLLGKHPTATPRLVRMDMMIQVMIRSCCWLRLNWICWIGWIWWYRWWFRSCCWLRLNWICWIGWIWWWRAGKLYRWRVCRLCADLLRRSDSQSSNRVYCRRMAKVMIVRMQMKMDLRITRVNEDGDEITEEENAEDTDGTSETVRKMSAKPQTTPLKMSTKPLKMLTKPPRTPLKMLTKPRGHLWRCWRSLRGHLWRCWRNLRGLWRCWWSPEDTTEDVDEASEDTSEDVDEASEDVDEDSEDTSEDVDEAPEDVDEASEDADEVQQATVEMLTASQLDKANALEDKLLKLLLDPRKWGKEWAGQRSRKPNCKQTATLAGVMKTLIEGEGRMEGMLAGSEKRLDAIDSSLRIWRRSYRVWKVNLVLWCQQFQV